MQFHKTVSWHWLSLYTSKGSVLERHLCLCDASSFQKSQQTGIWMHQAETRRTEVRDFINKSQTLHCSGKTRGEQIMRSGLQVEISQVERARRKKGSCCGSYKEREVCTALHSHRGGMGAKTHEANRGRAGVFMSVSLYGHSQNSTSNAAERWGFLQRDRSHLKARLKVLVVLYSRFSPVTPSRLLCTLSLSLLEGFFW